MDKLDLTPELRAEYATLDPAVRPATAKGAIDHLLASNAALEEEIAHQLAAAHRALRACRDQFEHYARNHHAKGTPDSTAKAVVNEQMAAMCARALAGEAE